jgi:hypothetical protein
VRRGRVGPRILERLEVGLADPPQDWQKIERRAHQPVGPADDHNIAWTDRLDELAELGAISLRSGDQLTFAIWR